MAGVARQGLVGFGMAGVARQGLVGFGMAGRARQGLVGFGMAGMAGMAWRGAARSGWARLDSAGLARPRSVGQNVVWHGRHGTKSFSDGGRAMAKDSIFREAAGVVFLAAVITLVTILFVQVERYYKEQEIDAAVAVYKRELQVYEKILTNPALCDQYEYKGRD